MEAIILAGGFGTRLRHIVPDVPKPMAPVCGQPFLQFILNDLIAKGIDRIILAVGYKKESISNYFGNCYRGAQIFYSEEDEPLFTGGAIKRALALCEDNDVFIINGDTFFDVDFQKMLETKHSNNASCLIAGKRMLNFERYGSLELENGQIVAFCEKKPMKDGTINGGIYCINKDFLSQEARLKFSFEADILEPLAGTGALFSFVSDGYFIDIGIPDDYTKAQNDFVEKSMPNKAAFFDRDGTINVERNYVYQINDFTFIDGIPEFIKKWNDWGYKVIVITNQAGIARGMYTEEEMRQLHRYINVQLSKINAHIDAFYYCPHHPDFTGDCNCRKPKPGMIEQAIKDFSIDVSKSILFGDKPWDIECAELCGVKGYLV